MIFSSLPIPKKLDELPGGWIGDLGNGMKM